MKRLLTTLCLTAAFTSTAATLETSLFYSSELDTPTSEVNISKQVIGWYYGIDVANRTYQKAGVDLTIKPTAIHAKNEITPTMTASQARQELGFQDILGELTETTGHIVVALGVQQGFTLADAKGISSEDKYDEPMIRFIGLSYDVLLDSQAPYNASVLAHEIGHTLGGVHSAGESSWANYAYPADTTTPCNDGYPSLMYAYTVPDWEELIDISGSSTCPADGTANMVQLFNTYGPKAELQHPLANNQSLSITVTEDINAQQFSFTVERVNTDATESGTLYIASHKQSPNLNAMEIYFDADEVSSSEIRVNFEDIYPLFDTATDNFSVYAVAKTSKEVSAKLTDIMDVNTLWVPAPVIPDTSEVSVSNPLEEMEQNSGGSLSWFGLLCLIAFTRFRLPSGASSNLSNQ
ncbi:M12 family metallo-peptidase [Photobacterium halotolerans]|uniref:Peptidase M10 metallopeptidase domain-containing protein n=1 Tax=Photobacterium halotolerans TaxID=265726 RepID=A0A0F5V6T1_9GAMM|nr:M12 family metallo-peptidase [Photobacterium halotolerans]KKC97900.1 hypothetical protein KY46_21415 [Photobacterium halotolerans]